MKDDKAFSTWINEHVAFKAAEDSKRLTLPPTADAYKVELPQDFTPPQGVKVEIDEANPLWAQGKAWAQKNGLSQQAFSEAIALVMGDRVSTEQTVAAARNAEVAKLGATGPARIDSLTNFFIAKLGEADGKQFMSRIFTAGDVKIGEKILSLFTSQGGASFNGAGREPDAGQRLTDAQYQALTYTQKKEYAEKFPQPKDAVH